MVARALNKLNAVQVAKISKPGRHSDGGGLYLFIDSHGRRRWIFMYARDGKRTELGLGSGRDLPLAGARTKARRFREILEMGGDPRAERAESRRIPTFGACADDYIESMGPSWRNAKHAAQWSMTLTKYAKPLRDKPVNTIATQDVLDVLQGLWQRTPETAERLRGRIENVLDAAKAKGHRMGENPAHWRGHLDQLLPRRQRLSRGHHAALPYDAMPDFLTDLRNREGIAARGLEFAVLTAARTGEVLGAQWSEIDIRKKLWTIPAERMKGAREHRVPLSPRAIEILQELAALGTEGHVFPGPKPNKPLSSMAMAMLLRRMRAGVTVHGFRSTFRDWASETTGFPHEVCEMALAHGIASQTEAAYRRGDLFAKRRKLMTAWAGYCDTTGAGKVVAMRKMAG